LLANQIGYYSLILGLLLSVLLCRVSIKDFNNTNKQINQNILSLSFLQLVFVIVSFLSLIVSFINQTLVMRLFLIILTQPNHYSIKSQELGETMKEVCYYGY